MKPQYCLLLLILIASCTTPRYSFYKYKNCTIEYVFQRLTNDTLEKKYYYKNSYLYINNKKYFLNIRLGQQLEIDIDKYIKKYSKRINFSEYAIDSTMLPCTGVEYIDTAASSFVRASDYIYQNESGQDTILYITYNLQANILKGNVTIPDSLCVFYEPNSSCPIPDQVFYLPFMQPVAIQKMSPVSSKWLKKHNYIKSKRNKFYIRYCD